MTLPIALKKAKDKLERIILASDNHGDHHCLLVSLVKASKAMFSRETCPLLKLDKALKAVQEVGKFF